VVLDLDLPVIVEEPSCDEVVVIGVEEVVAAPGLVCEAVGEFGVLQDLRSIRYCTAGQAGQATIDPVAGSAVKVSPNKVHGTEELPNVVAVYTAKLLVCSDTTHSRILERC
jgi:hypothetical protein